MTTTTTLIPAVTDYLTAQAQASSVLGGASPQVYVFDGPQPSKALSGVERALWIGWDPASEGQPAAGATQDFAFLDSGRTRDEDGEITCTAQHWSGDTTVKVHRDGCAAIVAGVELLLRGTPAAGGPGDASMGGLVLWSGVTGPYEWYPAQVPNGAQVLCVFKIAYRARLVTS
jgi:hypothetical protein